MLWKDNTAGTDNWLQVTVSHFSFHKPKQSHADVYLLSVVRFSRISGSTGQTDEWLNEKSFYYCHTHRYTLRGTISEECVQHTANSML